MIVTDLELPSTARFEFKVDGVPLVGRVFSPPAGTEPVVQAVLTGPLTSVKEQATGAYAAALAARGFIALAFDHRTFGESGGEPRQFEDPFAKIEDIRAAASALLERGGNGLPLVGVGVCAGAGYMARAVAEDPRFDAFAAVAGYFGEGPAKSDPPSAAVLRGRAAEAAWKAGGTAEMIPAVGPDGGDVGMPLREAYEYYGTPRGAVPNYVNGFAVQSLAYTGLFDSQGAAALITVPSIVIHSENALAPPLARQFIGGLVAEHDQLWLTSEGQIDFYDDPRLINAASDAIASFVAKSL